MSTQQETMFSPEERRRLLQFVRSVIAARLDRMPLPEVPADVSGLEEQGACFVTLHTADGMLRGCIGNIAAVEPLGMNIRNNAVNAAFRDPRFQPLSSRDELDRLNIEISVLTPMREIPSYTDFEVGRHGIVMQQSGRSAVFLPQVAPEQGWDRETTLQYLSQKAGLPLDAWREDSARFYVFEAVVFGETE